MNQDDIVRAAIFEKMVEQQRPRSLPAQFWSHLERGEVAAAMHYAPFDVAMHAVTTQTERLKALGVLEPIFVQAYYQASLRYDLGAVLTHCERAKLLAAATPLPSQGPFTVYRGVRVTPWPYCITSPSNVEGSLSWTTSLDFACNYAARQMDDGAYGQAVLRAIVPIEDVYFYSSPAGEQELVCNVDSYQDLGLSIREIRAGCDRFSAWFNDAKPGIGVGPILKV